MPRVVHFEIHADDPERAVRFYKKVFGWKIEKWQSGKEQFPFRHFAISRIRDCGDRRI